MEQFLFLTGLTKKILFILGVGFHVRFTYALEQTTLQHDALNGRHFDAVLRVNEFTEDLKLLLRQLYLKAGKCPFRVAVSVRCGHLCFSSFPDFFASTPEWQRLLFD